MPARCWSIPSARSPVATARLAFLAVTCWWSAGVGLACGQESSGTPDYARDIEPLLTRYCAGCHSPDEANGELQLTSFEGLMAGGDSGPALLPGQSESSRMMRMIRGEVEPTMPPEDEPAPTEEEQALLAAWIDAGAPGPAGAAADRLRLRVPELPQVEGPAPWTALTLSDDGRLLALARFGQVELRNTTDPEVLLRLDDHPGKVYSLQFLDDDRFLLTASGITGLYGEARLWDVKTGDLVSVFEGHRDILFAAAASPDGTVVATGGYDRVIRVWDRHSGALLHELKGHNGAVFDLAFHPDGNLLASASADETVKIWHVTSGRRLDTLPQPLAEQYCVCFSPDGRQVLAGGADNRLRVWDLVSRDAPAINPLRFARYAHEAALVQIAVTADGSLAVTAAEDGTLKAWHTRTYSEAHVFPALDDVPSAVVLQEDPRRIHVAALDGTYAVETLPAGGPLSDGATDRRADSADAVAANSTALETVEVEEMEPNDAVASAQPIDLPARVSGSLDSEADIDRDLFRFQAREGESWILETRAARDSSPADTVIAVRHENGDPVLRTRLQAVRDSYITFRGINSTSSDVRLHNWEEMALNQLLYMNGEVCRLFLAPRGPDSGFQLYNRGGRRINCFDTTPITHPLHEPSYIVEPLPEGAPPIPNGLPVFPVYYVNDDEARGRLQTDSLLHFVAPADGIYIAEVTDVRGFQGEDFQYHLLVRVPQPRFQASIQMGNQSIPAGSGREFGFTVDRIDGFDGEVRLDIEGLPDGLVATTPLTVEAGHRIARGTIYALPRAGQVAAPARQNIRVTATATIQGELQSQQISAFGNLQVAPEPRVLVSLAPTGATAPQVRRQWRALEPIEVTTASDATVETLSDRSVLIAGPVPDHDQYVLELPGQNRVAAIRLEALGHESLPAGGPGRSNNGNFVLSSVRVEVAGEDGEWKELPLAAAKADYSQSGWSVLSALDPNPANGWAVATNPENQPDVYVVKKTGNDPSHAAVFELAEPVERDNWRLRITLEHGAGPVQHVLGRFRVSVSDDVVRDVAELPELTIAPGQTVTAQLSVDRQGFEGRIPFESLQLNLPHGVIIDNIGLNGVLIPEGQTTRTIFLTCAPWVPETDRTFFLRANVEGNLTSWPMLLRIRQAGSNRR